MDMTLAVFCWLLCSFIGYCMFRVDAYLKRISWCLGLRVSGIAMALLFGPAMVVTGCIFLGWYFTTKCTDWSREVTW